MPIYEYYCKSCKKVSSFLLLRVTEEHVPYCKACGSNDVIKRVSRISLLGGEERILEGLLDPSRFSGLDESDPSSVGRVARRMGKELGGEFGAGIEEALEEALGGESSMAEEGP